MPGPDDTAPPAAALPPPSAPPLPPPLPPPSALPPGLPPQVAAKGVPPPPPGGTATPGTAAEALADPAPGGPLAYLEPGQLSAGARRPVRRAQLSRRMQALLCVLRLFVLALGAAVVYAFVAGL